MIQEIRVGQIHRRPTRPKIRVGLVLHVLQGSGAYGCGLSGPCSFSVQFFNDHSAAAEIKWTLLQHVYQTGYVISVKVKGLRYQTPCKCVSKTFSLGGDLLVSLA